MSRIFFTVNTDTGRAQVIASIYADGGSLLAEHRMTIEGAVIRMHDMAAAIEEARDIHGRPTRGLALSPKDSAARIRRGTAEVRALRRG
jgi:hypothetical protein